MMYSASALRGYGRPVLMGVFRMAPRVLAYHPSQARQRDEKRQDPSPVSLPIAHQLNPNSATDRTRPEGDT